jgi:hypothetical protein
MSIKVTLPYDPKWQALAWAKEHCESYITNITNVAAPTGALNPAPGGWIADYCIVYYFGHERDATLFALKWK